jgi:hypothetical protein
MPANIETLDNRAWVPHHIPNAIRKELYRRTLDQSMVYDSSNNTANWSNYKYYRGPLSAWTRITSNGTGFNKLNVADTKFSKIDFENQKRDGFVMYGGQGFDDSYGKKGGISVSQTNTILGYDVKGNPHTIDASGFATLPSSKFSTQSPILLPPPGIVSIEANVQKERIRKVTINWRCYGAAQLEYMIPYFLTPGISIIAEWGWNLFNIDSLIDLTDTAKLIKLYKDGTELYTNTIKSNGMYDATFGIISNYGYSSKDGVTYECKTEIFSKHRNHTGALMNEAPQNTELIDVNTGNVKEIITKPSFFEFCNQRLKNVTKCLEGSGKNFFENLTADEAAKLGFNNFDLIKNFYNGKTENRVFTARNKVKTDPAAAYEDADREIDWDAGSPDEVWVTMGFAIELLNLFIRQKITTPTDADESKYDQFTFDIEDVVIGGHPNLISADGNKLLIPNAAAPKYNLGAQHWISDYPDADYEKNKLQSQTSFKDAAAFEKASNSMNPCNFRLYHVFKTGYRVINISGSTSNFLGAYRDDLDIFINRFVYNNGNNRKPIKSAAFPQVNNYTLNGNNVKSGYWGYLKDLFVNVNVILDAARISHTAEEFLQILLREISGAAAGFWELAVVEADDKLKIIDKKFISKKVYQNLFQFDIAADSIIREYSMEVTPSSAQMTQIIAGSNNNQITRTGQSTATQLPDFYYGDRLGVNQIQADTTKNFINESSDLMKQLQKYGKVAGVYATTLKNKNSYTVLNLALPSKHLLLTLLDSKDYEDNLNIYGGQQPNFIVELTLSGIGGLRTFQCFSIKNLPKPYSPKDVIFSIIDISHSLQNGEWITVVKAGIRPIPKVSDGSSEFEYSNGKDAYDAIGEVPLSNLK